MSTFDKESFINSVIGDQQQQQDPVAAEGLTFDKNSFIDAMMVPSTGEARPDYADGLSEESPINSSPVDVVDRFKLTMGNEKGKLSFLKEKFEDAKVAPDGNFVVKTGGKWHRVDPTGLGDSDPWEKTKELVKDFADITPELTTMGATTAAGVGTGGAGILATGGIAGAVEIGRTSLGRAFGTYEADSDTQMKDIAFETLLNIGGAGIAAGVKPVGKVIAAELKAAGKAFAGVPQASKNLIATAIGTTSGAGPGNIMTYMNHTDDVANKLIKFSTGAVGSQEIVDRATKDSVLSIKAIAEEAQPTLNAMYGRMKHELLANADSGFKSNVQSTVADIYGLASKTGIGRFVKKGAEAIDDVANGPQGLISSAASKTFLSADEVMEQVAKTGRLPADVSFEMKPMSHLLREQEAGGAIVDLVNDKDAYRMMDDFFGQIKNFERINPNLKGRAAAEQVLDFQKVVGDMTWKSSAQAKDEAIPGIAKAMKDINTIVKTKAATSFDLRSDAGELLGNKFIDLNSTYSKASDELLNVVRTVRSADKLGDHVYESYLKQMTAPGNLMKKEGFGRVVSLAAENGNKKLESQFHNIITNESAKSLSPWVRKGVAGGVQGGLGVATAGAAISGNVAFAAGAAATLAGSSPALNRKVLDVGMGASKVSREAVKVAWDGMSMIRQRTPDQLKALVQNPVALQSFFGTIASTDQMKSQVRDMAVKSTLQRTTPVGTR